MASLRVVLDTNVVVSAFLKGSGLERYVLDLALGGRMSLLVSEDILIEYDSVLRRPKFKLPRDLIAESMELLRSKARIVRPRTRIRAAFDPEDDKFLECAVAGRAGFLVTGNKRHFPAVWKSVHIVNGREMLEHFIQTLKL